VAHFIFNSQGSDFVIFGQISPPKKVAIRTETILSPVLKFQVDLAGFHGEEAHARERWESGKRRRKKRKSRAFAVIIEHLHRYNNIVIIYIIVLL